MTWVEIKTCAGKPESKAILDPLPKGPYCLVKQSYKDEFEKDPHHFQGLIQIANFETRYGYCTYCVGPNFEPLLCGYHYDTSD
jgi:hypothetical protein